MFGLLEKKQGFKFSVTRVICAANNMSDHMWFVAFNKKLRLITDILHLSDSFYSAMSSKMLKLRFWF